MKSGEIFETMVHLFLVP